jgi:[FeFe] hydrogenase H-cluster maturation GTPase HydF
MTKPHIGIFGRRNNGKSSLINLLTGQDIAIVSEHAGTTTDPVKKSVEIFGIGPAILVDTAGIDDVGDLGAKRIKKTLEVIPKIDCALLVIAQNTFGEFETDLIRRFDEYEVPYVIVHNKSDIEALTIETVNAIQAITLSEIIEFNTLGQDIDYQITDKLKEIIPLTAYQKPSLFAGLFQPKDVVLLITPVDSEAPDGRMILPQNMAIRDVLDNDGICVVV